MNRAVGVLLVAVCAACGGGGAPLAAFDSAQAVADHLDCDDFEAHDPGAVFGGDMVTEDADCTADVGGVTITTFEDRAHRDQWLRQAETLGCAMASGIGVEEAHLAVGDNWVVALDDNLDAEGAASVADRLGGETRAVNC